MTLPDWLVERAALDEVAPANRARIDGADPRALADRIATLRADNAAELAAHPVAPAVYQIELRVAAERRRRTTRRLRWFGLAGLASVAVLLLVGGRVFAPSSNDRLPTNPPEEITRVKGTARLLVFRQTAERVEQLDEDALVRAGDLIQLRYNGGGASYGVIASVDGAGVVTLHHPISEAAPPEATALAPKPTALPHAYALDDAPRFERFFFITADAPIDVQQSLVALRAFARRDDCATAALELPAGLHQWSLRLRKPDPKPPTP